MICSASPLSLQFHVYTIHPFFPSLPPARAEHVFDKAHSVLRRRKWLDCSRDTAEDGGFEDEDEDEWRLSTDRQTQNLDVMCDFSRIYRRNLANIIARILFPGVRNLKCVPVGEVHSRVGRDFNVARGKNGNSTFPCQHISGCGGEG